MKKSLSVFLTIILFVGIIMMTGCSQEEIAEETPEENDELSFEGQTLNLYVAAGMKRPMDDIIEMFQDETGAMVAVNYGPSGGLYAQIEQDQPCDLYYSADWSYIEKVEEAGKLEESNEFLTDNIVVVVSDSGESKVKKVEDLIKADVTMTLADPQAPAGVYAKASLENLGLWEKAEKDTIKAMPSTVNQVAIMVKEDQVDAGLIYSSVANGNELKIVDVIDEKYSGEIIFGTAVIKGEQTEMARAFAELAVKNVEVFEKFGWKAYE